MKINLYKFFAVAMLFCLAASALHAQQSESRDGFYKDIFMDSGIKLTARKYLPASTHLQASIETFWHTKNTLRDTLMQTKCFSGSEMDSNGILLYPDGAPRFRVIYVNGGLAGRHGGSLGEEGRENMRRYVKGGGSFVGTCAGGYIGSLGVIKSDGSFNTREEYLHIWPGRTRDTYMQNKRLTMTVDKESPLLNYYDFGGDMKIDSIYHNNGGYAALEEGNSIPEGTVPLLRFSYDTLIPKVNLSIDGKVSCWGYKESDNSGRVILMSSHPEAIVTGERMHLMSALLQYAMDGNGKPTVKGELTPGAVREMNKSTEDKDPLFTKIGDRQYHHFTIEIPKRVKRAVVTLEGYEGADNFDLTLAVNSGDFALHNKTWSKNVALGCNKSLTIEKPQAGKWYVSVFCETTVTTSNGLNGIVYSGRTDVLNGVPYKIKVEFEK